MKNKRTKADVLSIKEQLFVFKVVETLNPTEAARQVYKCRDAKGLAKKYLKKKKIRTLLDEMMQQTGITREAAIKRATQIIMNPREIDGVSVAGLNLVGRWNGWEVPRTKVKTITMPSTEEINDIIRKIQSA